MKPENWFKRELNLLSRRCYPFWMNKYKKWFIVHTFHKRVPGITEYDPNSGKTFVVEKIVHENEKFIPLDGRLLRALRLMTYKEDFYGDLDKYLQEIDRQEDKEVEAATNLSKRLQLEYWHWRRKLQQSRTFS